MKKLLLSALLLVAIGFGATAQNNNKLMASARNAAKDCINDANEAGWEINGYQEVEGICFVQGSLTKITFYKTFRCHNQPCPKMMAYIIATVHFDCDDNVSAVECN